MAGSKASSPKRKAKQAENRTKAETRIETRTKASKGQNVAPGTFNGKSVGGYSLKPELILARAIRKGNAEASDEG